MVPWSVPSLVLGMQVLHGIVMSASGMNLPPDTRVDPHTLHEPIKDKVDPMRFLPRKRNRKPQRLMRRLGKDFDSFWMSKDKPSDFLDIATKRKTDTALSPVSEALDLSSLIGSLYAKRNLTNLPTGGGLNSVSDTKNPFVLDQMTRTLRNWLVEFSSCAVYYQWVDYGPIFFPRFIRKGMCSHPDAERGSSPMSNASPGPLTGESCSWPPGMMCIKDESKTRKLRILRWKCPEQGSDTFQRFRQTGRRKANSNHTARGDHEGGHGKSSGELQKDKLFHSEDARLLREPQRRPPRSVDSLSEKEIGDQGVQLENPHRPSGHVWNTPGGFTRSRERRSKSDGVNNKREDWNKGRRKGRRRKHNRCRWTRFTITETDHCYCSC